MPFLIDQQPPFVDGDVAELERGERVADPSLGIAVLDDRIGRQLRRGDDLQVDLDEVGLGRDGTLAGDGEALDVGRMAAPSSPSADRRTEPGPGGPRPPKTSNEANGRDGRLTHGESAPFEDAESARAVTSFPGARRG